MFKYDCCSSVWKRAKEMGPTWLPINRGLVKPNEVGIDVLVSENPQGYHLVRIQSSNHTAHWHVYFKIYYLHLFILRYRYVYTYYLHVSLPTYMCILCPYKPTAIADYDICIYICLQLQRPWITWAWPAQVHLATEFFQ